MVLALVVLYMCFSHGKAELIPIDKKPNDSIVGLDHNSTQNLMTMSGKLPVSL